MNGATQSQHQNISTSLPFGAMTGPANAHGQAPSAPGYTGHSEPQFNPANNYSSHFTGYGPPGNYEDEPDPDLASSDAPFASARGPNAAQSQLRPGTAAGPSSTQPPPAAAGHNTHHQQGQQHPSGANTLPFEEQLAFWRRPPEPDRCTPERRGEKMLITPLVRLSRAGGFEVEWRDVWLGSARCALSLLARARRGTVWYARDLRRFSSDGDSEERVWTEGACYCLVRDALDDSVEEIEPWMFRAGLVLVCFCLSIMLASDCVTRQ